MNGVGYGTAALGDVVMGAVIDATGRTSAVFAVATSDVEADLLPATPAAVVNALARGAQESAVYFDGTRVW